jgi:hypothetical protein
MHEALFKSLMTMSVLLSVVGYLIWGLVYLTGRQDIGDYLLVSYFSRFMLFCATFFNVFNEVFRDYKKPNDIEEAWKSFRLLITRTLASFILFLIMLKEGLAPESSQAELNSIIIGSVVLLTGVILINIPDT